MKTHKALRRRAVRAAAVFVATAGVQSAFAGSATPAYTFTQLASFNYSNGDDPIAGVTLDAAGDLFGTTEKGGIGGGGVVYKIVAGSGTITPLVYFNANSGATIGAYPRAGVLSDAVGNLTGAVTQGGTSGAGNLFQISSGSNTFTPIINFTGSGASYPTGTPVTDAAGNIYDVGNNTLFEVGATNHSATVLATFTGTYLPAPFAAPVFDKFGNLYGTTQLGGNSGLNGFLWRYTASTKTLTRLANFSTTGETGGVVFDSAGNLYVPAGGSILEVPAAQTLSTSTVTPTTLYTFTGGADGAGPNGPLLVDAAGDIFGTASGGGIGPNGQAADGTVFELTAGPTRTLNTLYTFTGAPMGDTPDTGLTMDTAGDLFGTTTAGGQNSDGSVFELSPVPTPEPAGMSMLAIGGLALLRRRRNSKLPAQLPLQ